MDQHISVFPEEVVRSFASVADGRIVDCTLGAGGHAFALLDRYPQCRVLGIDADRSAIAQVADERQRRGIPDDRLVLAPGNFRDCDRLVRDAGWDRVQGILFDFGFSSRTMSDATRGLSFLADGPLDMRFDQHGQEMTAATIVNEWSEEELAQCFFTLGGERASRRIAREMVLRRRLRPFTRTIELAECIARVAPRWSRIHPATKVFQALRIAVNDELGAIEDALPKACALLAPGGVLVTIAFHSLEDTIVKRFLRAEQEAGRMRIITKHVVRPTRAEVVANPRSRSARMRIAHVIEEK
jgi:16S rRNA (cytosine1402-N4)-methyltransferase